MAISFVITGSETTTYGEKTVTEKTAKGYFKAKDYENLPKDKPNATFATCIDWDEATSEQKDKMKDAIQIFDAEDKKWRPFLP